MTTLLTAESGHGPVELRSGGYRVISTEHAKIHDGKAFTHASIHLALANSGIYYHYINVPAGVYPHLRVVTIACEGSPFWCELYEAPTITADGTTAEIRNNNRASTTASTVTMFHAPTVTADGTLLDFSYVTGTGASGGFGIEIESEWVLNAGTKYVVKATNKSGAARDFVLTLFWYE